MSNSSLPIYVSLNDKNVNNRGTHTIKGIIPHCYVGQVTAKRGVDSFNARNDASVHYIAGIDGIGQQVDEKWRAWTTGGNATVKTAYGTFTGRDVDFDCVTIEIACDSFAPYAITSDVYAEVVNLMADIAKRNNLGELKWKADKSLVGNWEAQNVLVHRWFASKSCPGNYIYNALPEICRLANEVNRTGIPYKPQAPKMQAAKPTLRKGCKGAQVKLLQQNLEAIDISVGKYGCDGDFGDCTRSAVISFQKRVFPTTPSEWDGIYGSKSYNKMVQELAKL